MSQARRVSRFAELLTEEQVKIVHEASLEILEQVGILVRHAGARDRLARQGCRVDRDTQVVTYPRRVVEELSRACPPSFTFHGRDPGYDRTIPRDGPLMVTASSAPDILDSLTGEVRRARSDDIGRIAHLVNELPGYDIFAIATTADDAQPGSFSLARFYPALRNCLKPIRGSAPSLEEAQDVLRLCHLIAGSESAFRDRPFVTFQYCAMVSPLTMDLESTEKLIRYTEIGVPSYGVVAPNAGVTAPFTLLGTLAQCNAEFLAQTALEQTVRPGKAVVYDPLPTAADLRSGAYAPGGIETGVLLMGCAQMARYYGVPSGGFVGLTNHKHHRSRGIQHVCCRSVRSTRPVVQRQPPHAQHGLRRPATP